MVCATEVGLEDVAVTSRSRPDLRLSRWQRVTVTVTGLWQRLRDVVIQLPIVHAEIATLSPYRLASPAIAEVLLRSALVMEEDLSILDSLDRQLFGTRRTAGADYLVPAHQRWSLWPHFGKPWLLPLAAGTVLVSATWGAMRGLNRLAGLQSRLTGAILGGAASVVLTVAFTAKARRAVAANRAYRCYQTADEYVRKQEQLAITVSKAIRLVQEVELIARGYGLSARLAPITRLELTSRVRLCMPLRECIAHTLYVNLKASRAATRHLLREFPMAASVDYPGSFICNSKLADLGLCDAVDRATITSATNDMSLSYLKHLFDVTNQQRSEFLRRFCLSFSPVCQRDPALAAPQPMLSEETGDFDGCGQTRTTSFVVAGQLLSRWDDVLTLAGGAADWGVNLLEREMVFRTAEAGVEPAAVDGSEPAVTGTATAMGSKDPLPSSFEEFSSLSTQVMTYSSASIASLHLCHDRLRAFLASQQHEADEPTAEARAQSVFEIEETLSSVVPLLALASESLSLCQGELRRSLAALYSCPVSPDAASPGAPAQAVLPVEAGLESEAVVLQDDAAAAEGPLNFEAYTGARTDSEAELDALTEEEQKAVRKMRRAERKARREQRKLEEKKREQQRRRAESLMNELKSVIRHQ